MCALNKQTISSAGVDANVFIFIVIFLQYSTLEVDQKRLIKVVLRPEHILVLGFSRFGNLKSIPIPESDT